MSVQRCNFSLHKDPALITRVKKEIIFHSKKMVQANDTNVNKTRFLSHSSRGSAWLIKTKVGNRRALSAWVESVMCYYLSTARLTKSIYFTSNPKTDIYFNGKNTYLLHLSIHIQTVDKSNNTHNIDLDVFGEQWIFWVCVTLYTS